MRLLSVDPGDSVGIALWNDGQLLENYQISRDTFMIGLVDGQFEGVDEVVVESFRLFRNKASRQVGSKMPASLVLGALELWCRQRGLWMNKQDPSILPMAAMHANVDLPAGHLPDSLSAYLHGYYYLESKGILRPIDRVE